MSAPRAAAAVADDLAACRARDGVLVERLAAAEAAVAQRRDAIGDAVAVGDDVRALRAQLRDAEDDIDGLRRGRAALARTRATLETEHADAVVREARADAEAAADVAVTTAEALERAVGEFVAATVVPQLAAVVRTGVAARDAERAVDRARGVPPAGFGAVHDRFWHGRQAFEAVLTALDSYHRVTVGVARSSSAESAGRH